MKKCLEGFNFGSTKKQGGEVWDKLFEQAVERAAAAPLAYGYFALETQDEIHLSSAKLQLGVE